MTLLLMMMMTRERETERESSPDTSKPVISVFRLFDAVIVPVRRCATLQYVSCSGRFALGRFVHTYRPDVYLLDLWVLLTRSEKAVQNWYGSYVCTVELFLSEPVPPPTPSSILSLRIPRIVSTDAVSCLTLEIRNYAPWSSSLVNEDSSI